jgi:hypothetical protein
MTMRNGDKVVQMIPAAGYYAAYQNGDEITYNPVAAWIFVEDHRAVNAWTESIQVAATGMDRRAATRKASWSSCTGTSENAAAGDTRTAPCTPDAMRLGL